MAGRMNLRSGHGKEDASSSGTAPAGRGASTPKRQAPPARSSGRKTPTKADLEDLMRDLSPEQHSEEPPAQLGLPEAPGARLTPAAGENATATAAPPTTPGGAPPMDLEAGEEVVHISRRDLESMATRAAAIAAREAATVAAREAATLAAREAVNALTATRRSGSPANGQTHNIAEATTGQAENAPQASDPTPSSVASPSRVTGAIDSEDPSLHRGTSDVTCLGSQVHPSGAEGFSAAMGRITHVDAAQRAAHQARSAGASVAEQIVRAGAVGVVSASNPSGPHTRHSEPRHAGGRGRKCCRGTAGHRAVL